MDRRMVERILNLLWALRDYASDEVSLDAAAKVAAELLESGFVKPGKFRDALIEVLAAYGAEVMGKPSLSSRLSLEAKDRIRSILVVGANYAIIDNFDMDVVSSVKGAAWHGLKVIVYGEKAYIAGDNVEVTIDADLKETPDCIEGPELPSNCIIYVVKGRLGDTRVNRVFNRLDEAIDWVLMETLRYQRARA